MMRYSFLVFLFLYAASFAKAQSHRGILCGINFGSPIPSKIEKGASGKLQAGIGMGFYNILPLQKKWYLKVLLMAEQKRARYQSPVYYDYIIMAGDTINTFQGRAHGWFRNTYLTLPIQLNYTLGKKFSLGAGPYLSFLLKGQHKGVIREGRAGYNAMFSIPDQVFDESKQIKRFDLGASVNLSIAAYKRFSVYSLSNIGLISMHKQTDNFKDKLRNFYTSIMLAYRVY